MAIKLFRKANTTKAWDLTETQINVTALHDCVELSFTCGSSGGRTDFAIQIDGKDLKWFIIAATEAISNTDSKPLNTYSASELLEAIATKMNKEG